MYSLFQCVIQLFEFAGSNTTGETDELFELFLKQNTEN